MKRFIAILVVLILCVSILCGSLISCSSKTESENPSFSESNNNIVINEETAEQIAAAHLYEWVKWCSSALSYLEWAPSETRYSIGAVEKGSRGYTVNGKYSTYDKYGNYNDTYLFTIIVDSEGNADLIDAGDDMLNDFVDGAF